MAIAAVTRDRRLPATVLVVQVAALALLVPFAVFEIARHGPASGLGGVAGLAAGRWVGTAWLPLVLLVLLAVSPWTPGQVAPFWTAGLVWLVVVILAAMRREASGPATARD